MSEKLNALFLEPPVGAKKGMGEESRKKRGSRGHFWGTYVPSTGFCLNGEAKEQSG